LSEREPSRLFLTAEGLRLAASRRQTEHWKRWGPYLSERQWGTVREDYSPGGTAWEYLPHDHARSRAYRWGEDGLAGICDRHQQICFALALWNERDPILKERLFGLTGNEGNHGEDVKEYYFYLDSTPTHSYMRWLYKYPQREFPYCDLVEENRRRGRQSHEYELIDTGVFDEDRYFDVAVEYAKATPEEILVRITATNHGPEAASLHILPTIWFRNTWSWGDDAPKPRLERGAASSASATITVDHHQYGRRWLVCEGRPELLFTENETNARRLWGSDAGPIFAKDGIHDYVVSGVHGAVNPSMVGTKAAANYGVNIPAGGFVACGTTNVTVQFAPSSAGGFTNTVTFTNLTNGNGTTDRVVTLTIIPLPAPSNLSATPVTNGQVNLSWTDNSNGEDGFKIERAPDNGGVPGTWAQIDTVSNNVTTYSDFGLNPSTRYWYRVRAFNSLADSDYSNLFGITTLPRGAADAQLFSMFQKTRVFDLSTPDTVLRHRNGCLSWPSGT